MHTGSPLAFLRHSVVVVVWQLVHWVPARLLTIWGRENVRMSTLVGGGLKEVRVRLRQGFRQGEGWGFCVGEDRTSWPG